MALEITQILLNAQSPDGGIRKIAEDNLKQFQDQNLPNFLLSLSFELSSDEKPVETRRLAGIILKNSLDAKESTRKEDLLQKWVALDSSLKAQIKDLLLRTIGSSSQEARHTSSQVIAKVAAIEIPRKEWPDLIVRLLTNMTSPVPNQPENVVSWIKQATLETLGYVCEEISPQDLEQDQVNSILTAVVQGMGQNESNSIVRLSATKALYNALDFAETNFQNEMERNYIMKVVCEVAVSKESEIRKAAFECLVSISSTYYEVLSPYMQSLFELTSNAIKSDEEEVSLQAVEFWSSICDVEIEIQEGCDDTGSDGYSSASHSHFIKQALPVLAPLLLETLTKQDEDQDQDEGAWNLAMAGGTCLGLVARTVGDDIVPLVIPFVENNITKPDWHCREAATYAFGSILEGPSVEKLAPLVQMGMQFMLNALMQDPNCHVKDTTAWTLSRIFELLHSPDLKSSVISPSNIQQILAVLLKSLNDAPNVAEKVCGAIYFLAQGFEDSSSSLSLSPFLHDIISSLLSAADRNDASQSRLRSASYETLNEVIRCSNLLEDGKIIEQLLPVIMDRLEQTMNMQVISSDDKEKQGEVQASLCGVIQVMIQTLGASEGTKGGLLLAADRIMRLFLGVFACRSTTVHEEAMLAIGSMAYATGPEFDKYMSEFYKYLEMGLQNFEEYQVCSISVGVVGDICRALDDKVLKYCDGIMTHLLKDLSSSMLHRSVKPPIFSCFGDIALAIEQNFEKYLPYAMPMLQGASEVCATLSGQDEEMVDYGNQLRRGILEAYSGILQGFKNSKAELMMPYASHLLQFIEAVFQDKDRDENVTKAAVGVLGDLADTLGVNTSMLFQGSSFYIDFLGECLESEDAQLKETASWAKSAINRVLVS